MNVPAPFEFDVAHTGRVRTQFAKYVNGRLAIQLVSADSCEGILSAGEPVGMLTVNIPSAELEDGEFLVKTWSENEDLAGGALASGRFVDTGRRVPTGHVEAQVWRFKSDGE